MLLKPAAVHITDFCVKTPLRFGLAGGCGGGARGPGSVAGAGTGIGAVPVGGGGGSSGRVSCGEGELLSAGLEVEVHLVGGEGFRDVVRLSSAIIHSSGHLSFHTLRDREGLFCCAALLPYITAAIRRLSPRRPQRRSAISSSSHVRVSSILRHCHPTPLTSHLSPHAGSSFGTRPLPCPRRAPPGRPRWPARYGSRYVGSTARTGFPGGYVVRPRHGRDQGR